MIAARWILAIVAMFALAFGAAELVHHIERTGYDRAKAEDTLISAKAESDARQRELAMNQKLQEAENAAKKRETQYRAAAAALRSERDGLRDDLAASRRELSNASRASIIERAAALDDILNQCSTAYADLAQKADRHASDTQLLIDAWPK